MNTFVISAKNRNAYVKLDRDGRVNGLTADWTRAAQFATKGQAQAAIRKAKLASYEVYEVEG